MLEQNTVAASTSYRYVAVAALLVVVAVCLGVLLTYRATREPTIEVAQPVSGSVWKVGSMQVVEWVGKNAPPGAWVALSLQGGNIRLKQPVSGSYNWTVTESLCQGDVCGVKIKTGEQTLRVAMFEGDASCLTFPCPPGSSVKLLAEASATVIIEGR